MNYLGIDKASISNGPGVRVVLWVSGCKVHCKGCQNPESWDFNAGKLFDDKAKQELFDALSKPYIHGLTISGGHPLEKENIADVYRLVGLVKTHFPHKDIWLYTGRKLQYNDFNGGEHFLVDGDYPIIADTSMLLYYCDVVVDGPYIEEQRDITLRFRGSKNQRLIDVKETIKQGEIITIQN